MLLLIMPQIGGREVSDEKYAELLRAAKKISAIPDSEPSKPALILHLGTSAWIARGDWGPSKRYPTLESTATRTKRLADILIGRATRQT